MIDLHWATPEDVMVSWIGADAPTDDVKLAVWIARAERLLRREFPTLTERVEADNGGEFAETVRDVIVAMVTRVFRNPAGHRSVTGQETTGQFSGSNTITFGGDNPGALELLDSERAMLSDGLVRKGRAFNISVGPSCGYAVHDNGCSVIFGARYCSCGSDINDYRGPIYGTGGVDA